MGKFFLVVAALAVIILAFVLFSSTSTNIYNQGKEIAILRALGITPLMFFRLYFYETFLVVLTARYEVPWMRLQLTPTALSVLA